METEKKSVDKFVLFDTFRRFYCGIMEQFTIVVYVINSLLRFYFSSHKLCYEVSLQKLYLVKMASPLQDTVGVADITPSDASSGINHFHLVHMEVTAVK